MKKPEPKQKPDNRKVAKAASTGARNARKNRNRRAWNQTVNLPREPYRWV